MTKTAKVSFDDEGGYTIEGDEEAVKTVYQLIDPFRTGKYNNDIYKVAEHQDSIPTPQPADADVSETMILAFTSADAHWSGLPEGTRPPRAEYIIRHIQETVGGQCWEVSGRQQPQADVSKDEGVFKSCPKTSRWAAQFILNNGSLLQDEYIQNYMRGAYYDLNRKAKEIENGNPDPITD